jgi:hypothetical protein
LFVRTFASFTNTALRFYCYLTARGNQPFLHWTETHIYQGWSARTVIHRLPTFMELQEKLLEMNGCWRNGANQTEGEKWTKSKIAFSRKFQIYFMLNLRIFPHSEFTFFTVLVTRLKMINIQYISSHYHSARMVFSVK